MPKTPHHRVKTNPWFFSGRSTLKHYMPVKPIKRGYIVWCHCDSASGYLYKFDKYTRKTNNGIEGLGTKIVKKLSEKLIEKGIQNVYMIYDNLFFDYKPLDYYVNTLSM